MKKIVVGVDESAPAQKALAWALEEAKLRDAELEVLHVWIEPALFSYSAPPIALEDMQDAFEKQAQAELDQTLKSVIGEEDPGVPITSKIIYGSTAETLVDAAADAEMLVLGSRGRGGFKGLLLGSVSAQCAHHAHCPVVIIHS